MKFCGAPIRDLSIFEIDPPPDLDLWDFLEERIEEELEEVLVDDDLDLAILREG